MWNNMTRVAAILGKRLHEKFRIKGLNKKYSFESCGLVEWESEYSRSLSLMDCYMTQLMTGELVIEEDKDGK